MPRCTDLIAVSRPAHFVMKLSHVEVHGCPRDARPGQSTVLAVHPFQEPRLDSADLCPRPEEGYSHLLSFLARTLLWDGTFRSFLHLPFPGSSTLSWGLLPKALSHWGHHETAREEAASPASNNTRFCTAAFPYRPECSGEKEGYYCSLPLVRAEICSGPRLIPVGQDLILPLCRMIWGYFALFLSVQEV